MGGRAFPLLSTPRLSPQEYQLLTSQVAPILRSFYQKVALPPEAPEKDSHGDLDFIVSAPLDDHSVPTVDVEVNSYGSVVRKVKEDFVGQKLGATAFVVGKPTSNFAVPLGSLEEFYQVDVHVSSESDFEGEVFWASYGDFAMILGSFGASLGFSVGLKGLRIKIPQSPALMLTTSPREILTFMQLPSVPGPSLVPPFTTQDSLFSWISTSPLFCYHAFIRSTSPEDLQKRKYKIRSNRAMFQGFVAYCNAALASGKPCGRCLEYFGEDEAEGKSFRQMLKDRMRVEALATFGKTEEYRQRVEALRVLNLGRNPGLAQVNALSEKQGGPSSDLGRVNIPADLGMEPLSKQAYTDAVLRLEIELLKIKAAGDIGALEKGVSGMRMRLEELERYCTK
ncbi:hypothetical protein BT69DRAFT_1330238 [Atractiella rhizophila]|nr:hypothetical protein BT69DRAFT_1330238 [Atractiella rhizophila]